MKNIILVGLLLLSGAICASEKKQEFEKQEFEEQEYNQYEVVTNEFGKKVRSETPSLKKLRGSSPKGQNPFNSTTYAIWVKNKNLN